MSGCRERGQWTRRPGWGVVFRPGVTLGLRGEPALSGRRIRQFVPVNEEQCGFQRGRGTVGHLFTLARPHNGSWEFAHLVYVNFVDLEKAFHWVPRRVLWGGADGVWGAGSAAVDHPVYVRVCRP